MSSPACVMRIGPTTEWSSSCTGANWNATLNAISLDGTAVIHTTPMPFDAAHAHFYCFFLGGVDLKACLRNVCHGQKTGSFTWGQQGHPPEVVIPVQGTMTMSIGTILVMDLVHPLE